MKKSPIIKTTLLFLAFALSYSTFAQVGGWNPKLQENAKEAMDKMLKEKPKLQTFYDQAYGYAVYPKVTKAGLGIGGAGGKGIVYQNHTPTGSSKLKQGSIGFQAGAQQFSEIIFFKDEAAFKRFANGKLKFDAQASAVALTEGASIDAAYSDGVAVFTQALGGLMYEASIGGQHFTFKPIE